MANEVVKLKTVDRAPKPKSYWNTHRPIQTVYYHEKRVLQINHAKYANKAVPNAVNHMQLNHYGASLCEVFDAKSGVLHAVITYSRIGEMVIAFKREITEGM